MSESLYLVEWPSTYGIATAVYAQLCGQENSGNEGEEDSKYVGRKKRYHGNALDEGPNEADYEDYPG